MTDRRLLLEAAATDELVGRIVDAALHEIGLPGFLLALLTHVRDAEPVAPSQIARAAGVPPTTMRDNVQRLVDRRLVERVPHPEDGRSYLLVTTAEGRSVAAAAGEALHEVYLRLGAALPRPREHYERALRELNEALRSTVGDAGPIA